MQPSQRRNRGYCRRERSGLRLLLSWKAAVLLELLFEARQLFFPERERVARTAAASVLVAREQCALWDGAHTKMRTKALAALRAGPFFREKGLQFGHSRARRRHAPC